MSTKYPSLRLEDGFLASEIIDDIAEAEQADRSRAISAFQTKLI